MDSPWLESSRHHRNVTPLEYERGLNLSVSGISQSEDDEFYSNNKKKLSRMSMVTGMITHYESAMKDRLSDKTGPVSQTPPHRSMAQCENATDDQADRTMQNRSQAKNASKEDPMSHRIIEKRRRDRMNNCLTDLSRLIPAEYMKKGRGRVEKTEIIEMAIKHMKYLQSNVSSSGKVSDSAGYQPRGAKEHEEPAETERASEQTAKTILIEEQYKLGYFDCLTETLQYLVDGHGYPPSHGLCLSLVNHLQNHCSQIVKGEQVTHEVVKDEFVLELDRFNTNMLMDLSANGGDGTSAEVESDQQQQNSPTNSKSQSSSSTSNEQALAEDRCSMSFTSDSYSSANSSMYKFKTDIKQRFSAESCSGADSTDYYAPVDKKRRRRETSSPADCGAEDHRQDVPIFALHANGLYYVPLTVNRDVISPMLDSVLQTDNSRSSSVILYPISISVDFQASNHHHHHHHHLHHHRQF